MRFSPRLVLAASAAGLFAASSGTALLMAGSADEPVVPLPVPDPPAVAAGPTAPAPVRPDDAGSPDATRVPVVTGAQIAALALFPARDRAEELIAAQASAAAAEESARASDDDDDDDATGDERDQWRQLRDEIREACDDGRIRGAICRG